ncbi:hypothetical protein FH972_016389 [Carpinus fangiana]|uniref:Cyclic nucleotide-binding domain-containing protein n=1 Tax=Carpinus fangiana TaxID=176857 RepID=A0A5N6RJA3_9ROSI|nr:hypothetical protein FH972_016389 [Carpinus fangiana]
MATGRPAKEKEIRSKIESWVTINELPCDMKEQIINCIQEKLEETKDFDIEKLFSHLSKDLITEIKHRLCLPLLKKVPQLQGPNGLQLQLKICDYLKPVHYNQHHYIVREGEPLDAMLFITQGIVWNFTTIKGKGSANWIEKDGFYGEELLNWGLELSDVANISNLPMSTKSLKTHTEVEAFALMASDLRTIVSRCTEAEREIELWIFRNQLPGSIKEEIMPIVQHMLEEKKDVDVQNLLSHLPIELGRKIKRYICLPMIKKVPQLQGKGEQLLQLICDYLKPVHYNQHHYIVREGEPLDAMLFITQGIIWNFSTTKGKGSAECIEGGSFYGEQLLDWGLDSPAATLPNLSNLPISPTTVKTHTKVEAFALMANDLRTIVSRRTETVSAVQAASRRFNELKNIEISSVL